MLTDLLAKIKIFWREHHRDLFLAALVFLMSMASFGLGRLSAIWPTQEPIAIEEPKDEGQKRNGATAAIAVPSSFGLGPSAAGSYVASKNGSSYHRPDCPGAKQIKEENRLWFQTAEDARRAGYQPAGNCPDLK